MKQTYHFICLCTTCVCSASINNNLIGFNNVCGTLVTPQTAWVSMCSVWFSQDVWRDIPKLSLPLVTAVLHWNMKMKDSFRYIRKFPSYNRYTQQSYNLRISCAARLLNYCFRLARRRLQFKLFVVYFLPVSSNSIQAAKYIALTKAHGFRLQNYIFKNIKQTKWHE